MRLTEEKLRARIKAGKPHWSNVRLYHRWRRACIRLGVDHRGEYKSTPEARARSKAYYWKVIKPAKMVGKGNT